MALEPLLAGERVRLTLLDDHDIDHMTKWYNTTDYARHLDALPAKPKRAEDLRKWRDEAHEHDSHFLFAIKEADQFIGFVELDGILWTQQNAWLTIGIGDPDMYGKGYGTEAMELLIQFAFHELNLHRLQLTVFEYNTAARRLYEKLGFVHEGSHREFILRDGRAYDMLLYGLLRKDWNQKTQG
ncbi:GNAT family N-acetyltransferase [Halobacillus sp. K22]|uniref:GNAT family N-acetyltransferase n=1 Tax=Halobacillus sp. K22 TaxID=3457431 RepID=UPI003FCD5C83